MEAPSLFLRLARHQPEPLRIAVDQCVVQGELFGAQKSMHVAQTLFCIIQTPLFKSGYSDVNIAKSDGA